MQPRCIEKNFPEPPDLTCSMLGLGLGIGLAITGSSEGELPPPPVSPFGGVLGEYGLGWFALGAGEAF